jgi:hypothetical protein
MNNPTVYVMVRIDIPIHQQLIQVGHACFNSGRHFGEGQHDDGPNLVVVIASDEAELSEWAERAEKKIPIQRWSDAEDYGQGESSHMTAFATAPIGRNQGRKLFWNVPLWSLVS